MRDDFCLLVNGVTFLNHGSFGALPKVVNDLHSDIQKQYLSDYQGVRRRRLEGDVLDARSAIAAWTGFDMDGIVLMQNATEAIATALRCVVDSQMSVWLGPFEYESTRVLVQSLVDSGAAKESRVLPKGTTNEVDRRLVEEMLQHRVAIVLSHVSSPWAGVAPADQYATVADSLSTPLIIDGAHSIGGLIQERGRLGPMFAGCFFAASLHKWAFCPRGSGFLYVPPGYRGRIRPWAAGAQSMDREFAERFKWLGTRDYSWIGAVAAGFEFLDHVVQSEWPSRRRVQAAELVARLEVGLGMKRVEGNREMETMMSWLISADDARRLRHLFEESRIRVWVNATTGSEGVMRVSLAPYVSSEDIDKLCSTLEEVVR